jgi:hypothetical protein
MTQPDGDVELWGFHRTLDAIGFVYDPPVLLVDARLEVGKTWFHEIDYYSYPDPRTGRRFPRGSRGSSLDHLSDAIDGLE